MHLQHVGRNDHVAGLGSVGGREVEFFSWCGGGDDDVVFSQYSAESLNISMRMIWPAFVFGMWEKLHE